LNPDGIGKISFANSVVNYFSMFAMLGIPTYGIRACAQVRDDPDALAKTVQEIWLINIATTILAYIVLGITVAGVGRLQEERLLILVCSAPLLLNLIAMEWVFKALECYSYITIRSLAFKVLAIILMFLMVHNPADYVRYAGITVIANTGYGILNFFYLRRYIHFGKFRDYHFRVHLKPILIFFAMSVAVTIYSNLDITMLGFMKGDTEVGYYDVAIKVKVILVNIVTSLGAVLLPRTSYYVEQKRMKEFWAVSAKAMEFVFVIAVPMIAAFYIMAEPCIRLLSGSQYAASVIPMRVIMPTLLLIGISNVLGIQILIPLGKESWVLYSEIAGAIVDILLNAAFIPGFGAAGAAFGTVMAELAVVCVQIYALKKDAIDLLHKVELLKVLISTALAAGAMVLVDRGIGGRVQLLLQLIFTFGSFGIVYGGSLLLLKESVSGEILESVYRKITGMGVVMDFIKNKELKQKAFLAAYVIYLCYVIIFASLYGEKTQLRLVFLGMRCSAYLLVCGKLVLDLLDRRFSKKELLIAGMTGILLLVSGYITKNKNLLIYWIFILAAHDIELEKLAKWSVIAHLAGLGFVVGSCYLHILENHIFDPAIRMRESLGFSYTTECSNFFFYTILCWIYWRKEKISWKEIGAMAVIQVFLFAKTDTKNAFSLGMAALCGSSVLKCSSFLRTYRKIYTLPAVGLAPAASTVMLVLSAYYNPDKAWMNGLNQLINGRLLLGKNAFDTYGITWLGQQIEWVGGVSSSGNAYNYVDSSYVQTLLNFGIIVYAMVLIGLIVFGISIAKKKDTCLLLVFLLIVIHSMFDPQLLWIGYDAFCMGYYYVKCSNNGSTLSR
jgi:O-antigen/teichoic acid export membrane protein